MTTRKKCRVDFSNASEKEILSLASRLSTLLPRRRPFREENSDVPAPSADDLDRTADILPFKTKE